MTENKPMARVGSFVHGGWQFTLFSDEDVPNHVTLAAADEFLSGLADGSIEEGTKDGKRISEQYTFRLEAVPVTETGIGSVPVASRVRQGVVETKRLAGASGDFIQTRGELEEANSTLRGEVEKWKALALANESKPKEGTDA
jgi:hypothetical protein